MRVQGLKQEETVFLLTHHTQGAAVEFNTPLVQCVEKLIRYTLAFVAGHEKVPISTIIETE